MSPLNWIAHLVYQNRLRHDLRFDRRLGLDTLEVDLNPDTGRLPDRDRSLALHYAPTPIALFTRFVKRSRLSPRDFTLVDLGAGKGRTLLLASKLGFRMAMGVEIDPRLCRIAQENIIRCGEDRGPVPTIIHGDARSFPFPPGHLFIFLFNPFVGRIFEDVASRLARLAREDGRAVVIVYHNDSCSALLEQTGAFRRVRMRRIMFWRPPTVSFFYNEQAWRMREPRYAAALRASRAARWRTVRGPATRHPGATDSSG